MTTPVVVFDFDGTLTRRDTLLPFLGAVAGRVNVARALGPAAWHFVARGRDDAKEQLLTRVLRGRDRAEIAAAGRAYGAHLVARAIVPPVRDRLVWHQREGHRVMIVSASLDVYLSEVARALAIDDLICTELETDAADRLTGRILGANCRGAEKVARLRARLGDDAKLLWAYGDGSGDEAMLALAANPVRVRRGRLDRSRTA